MLKALFRCYEVAPSRVKQYLEAEIRFVISNIHRGDLVLELGCGYGRVLKRVSPLAAGVVGNDTSRESLQLARSYLDGCGNCSVFLMDALSDGFSYLHF